MEDLIKQFLTIDGDGDGSSYGSGYGDGDGSGYGDGDGSGSGDGYGSGDGDGSGSGDGDGSGYGYGSGYGDGYGSGYGDGSGSGSGSKSRGIDKSEKDNYRKGFLNKEIHGISTFKGIPVYYVDNIPCVFLAIKGNSAKVNVIKDDFSFHKSYIAKSGNLFAHGDSKESALRSVNEKFYASLSFSEKKEEFKKTFNTKESYPNEEFYKWHHLLTGSCDEGRKMFVESKGIDLNGKMTVLEFLNLTKNEYNGEVLKELTLVYSK